jgi:hypothetical protein
VDDNNNRILFKCYSLFFVQQNPDPDDPATYNRTYCRRYRFLEDALGPQLGLARGPAVGDALGALLGDQMLLGEAFGIALVGSLVGDLLL